MGQLLVLHRLLKAGSLLPKETLPRGEVGPLEEGVFQDPFDSTQSLDHVRAVVVEVPQLPVMTLVGPPERVLLQHLPKSEGMTMLLLLTHYQFFQLHSHYLSTTVLLVVTHTHTHTHPLYLKLFEVCSHSPTFVIGKSVSILLEQGVNAGNSPVP